MSNKSASLHYEILDQNRKLYFDKLTAFRPRGYLAGGTALALQLGHRVSLDFDIFCEKPISPHFRARVRSILPIGEIVINTTDEFTFFTPDSIKITFLFYPFNLRKYVAHSARTVPLLNPTGIALSKAYALHQRNAWRDYFDLYYLIKNHHITLEQIIKQCQQVYQEMFSEKLFLAQLVYTKDINPAEIKATKGLLNTPVTLRTAEDFFTREIKKLRL